MSLSMRELAQRIATLDPADQEALLDTVAELNAQRGLNALSRKFRKRLLREGKLERNAEEVLAELNSIRERIVADDCPA